MKRSIIVAVVVGVVASLHAADISQKVTFDANAKELKGRTFAQSFGDVIKVDLKEYADEIFGVWVVNVAAEMQNTGKQPLFYQCCVAFFDARGKLVLSTNFQSTGATALKPGEKRRLSNLLYIPFEKIGHIASVQAVLYESEEPLGVRPPVKK